jgi:phage recombination protein Bet
MASTAVVALPASGDSSQWTDSEKALVEAAGLVSAPRNKPKELAPRPVVEAFLMQCRRTGLDPIARQIYCIQRAGKWQTQVSIDGARLVAERSGDYEGQTSPQWSDDGRTWFDAWVAGEEPEAHPRFARVGVYRRGFRDALTVVARWESYAVYDDVWENNRKTGDKKLSAMWSKMPDLMLAKVAEMLALRKAFPQDLSGLYSTEEMQQADRPPSTERTAQQPAQPSPQQEAVPERTVSRDWVALASACRDRDQLRAVYRDAETAGELGLKVGPEADAPEVGRMLWTLRDRLPEQAAEEVVEAEVVEADGSAEDDAAYDWPTATPGGEQS